MKISLNSRTRLTLQGEAIGRSLEKIASDILSLNASFSERLFYCTGHSDKIFSELDDFCQCLGGSLDYVRTLSDLLCNEVVRIKQESEEAAE